MSNIIEKNGSIDDFIETLVSSPPQSPKSLHLKIETDDFTEDMIMFGNSCTLFYLKNILKENKLKVSGNKKELIKRVYDNNLQQK